MLSPAAQALTAAAALAGGVASQLGTPPAAAVVEPAPPRAVLTDDYDRMPILVPDVDAYRMPVFRPDSDRFAMPVVRPVLPLGN